MIVDDVVGDIVQRDPERRIVVIVISVICERRSVFENDFAVERLAEVFEVDLGGIGVLAVVDPRRREAVAAGVHILEAIRVESQHAVKVFEGRLSAVKVVLHAPVLGGEGAVQRLLLEGDHIQDLVAVTVLVGELEVGDIVITDQEFVELLVSQVFVIIIVQVRQLAKNRLEEIGLVRGPGRIQSAGRIEVDTRNGISVLHSKPARKVGAAQIVVQSVLHVFHMITVEPVRVFGRIRSPHQLVVVNDAQFLILVAGGGGVFV